jgi:MYXO-CTERM domain-containing protein
MLSHASRSSRHVFLISAAVALLVGGLARTATAKTCTTDLDCDTGYQCAIQAYAPTGGATSVGSGAATGSLDNGTGGAGGSVASAGGVVGSSCPKGSNCVEVPPPPTQLPMPVDAGFAFTPDAGVLAPDPEPTPVTGICEPKPIVCTTVADCPSADFDCVMEMMPTIAPTCPANTICPTPSPPVPPSTCVAKLHACSAAADCPAPLDCQAQYKTCSGGGAVAPDGTVTMMPETCTPGPSVCSWNPVTCTIDTGCADPLYQCVKVGESGGCASSGGACAAGETCPPVPQQPTCDTTPTMLCLPTLVDCACGPCPAGVTCGACATCLPGWSCFDFSSIGGVPSAWGSVASNKACLPDGIIMAAQKHAAVNGEFGGSSSSTGSAPTLSAGDAGVSTNAGPSPVNPVPPGTNEGAGNAAKDTVTHSSGCAYGGGDASSLWLALAMIGLVARLARRRR